MSDDDWLMGSVAAQDDYKPVEAPRRVYITGEDLPDVGSPLVSPGPQISAGQPWANKTADVLSRYPGHVLGGMASLPKRAFEASEERRLGGEYDPAPAVEAALTTMGTGAIAGVPVKGGETVLGAGPVRKVKPNDTIVKAPEEIAPPAATNSPSSIIRPNQIERYVTDPQRIYKPGIYKDPRAIAAEANARVAPEHPAMKELFGVTRDDLYGISQQGARQGNVEPNIFFPAKPGENYAAKNIMNPANAQRLIDTLTEARKYPGLERGMIPWYVMDPAFKRLEQLVGPERAITEYNRFNYTMTPFSASSNVLAEINRGTGARMMANKGRFPEFMEHAGYPTEKRGADFPQELSGILPHLRHGEHVKPVARWLETGEHGYGKETVKIPLYSQASGVPQTGFQTAWAVPDAHFSRAVGMSDVRTNAVPGNFMVGSEYRTMSPWFRKNVAQPLGIEAVPAQALTWGAYAPQTGVKTPIGAGKLELISQRIWERAKELGVDPHWLRDQVLLGEEHAELEGDNRGLGSQSAYG